MKQKQKILRGNFLKIEKLAIKNTVMLCEKIVNFVVFWNMAAKE
jgi:hypothetical protein